MFFRASRDDNLSVLVVVQGIAGTQRLVVWATTRNIQLSMIDLLLLMSSYLYPAAWLLLWLLWFLMYFGKQTVKLNPHSK